MTRYLQTTGVLLLILVLLCACSHGTPHPAVVLEKDASWFNDFEVRDPGVIIECIIMLNNSTNETQYVELFGHFDDDHNLGLLTESGLYAQLSPDDSSTAIEVPPGKHEYTVYFCGTFGGTHQKTNRLLPEIDVVVLPADA